MARVNSYIDPVEMYVNTQCILDELFDSFPDSIQLDDLSDIEDSIGSRKFLAAINALIKNNLAKRFRDELGYIPEGEGLQC